MTRPPRQTRPPRTGPVADPVGESTDELTARQRAVLLLIAEGLTLRDIAQQLGISDATLDGHRRVLLRKFGVDSTRELRLHAALVGHEIVAAPRQAAWPSLRHQSHHLPNPRLGEGEALSRICRQRFHCERLRDVADLVRDFDQEPGDRPDDPVALLEQRTGTLGAKQALLAIIARESGVRQLRLIIACHELSLDKNLSPAPGLGARTLPMAVCYLGYQGRRIQIADSDKISRLALPAVTEVELDPSQQLARERIRLYRGFAADWCRALEVSPRDFAHLRAAQLAVATQASVIEDLLGHGLPPGFEPIC